MSAKGISLGEVKDVTINIRSISNLTLDDFEFVQQCERPKVSVTPPLEEHVRLIGHLQFNP